MGAGTKEDRLAIVDQFARRREGLAGRADVDIALLVEREVLPAKGPVVALLLVDHRDMRLDILVLDEPIEVLS
jgi:hypothetical protein